MIQWKLLDIEGRFARNNIILSWMIDEQKHCPYCDSSDWTLTTGVNWTRRRSNRPLDENIEPTPSFYHESRNKYSEKTITVAHRKPCEGKSHSLCWLHRVFKRFFTFFGGRLVNQQIAIHVSVSYSRRYGYALIIINSNVCIRDNFA